MAGSITSLPSSIALTSQSAIDTLCQVGTGGAATHLSTGSWNGSHAVKLWLQTDAQGYSCIRDVTLSGSASGQTQLNIRLVIKMPQAFMEDDSGVGPKHVILLRANGDEGLRFIAQMHGFASGPEQWDMGLGNSVSPSFPSPRVWDYHDHVSDFVCFEFQAVIGGSMKFWITKQTGATWNETDVYAAASDPYPSCTSGSTWSAIDVLGSFGGPGDQGASNADAFMLLSDIVVSNTYIGPPAGFRGVTPRFFMRSPA